MKDSALVLLLHEHKSNHKLVKTIFSHRYYSSSHFVDRTPWIYKCMCKDDYIGHPYKVHAQFYYHKNPPPTYDCGKNLSVFHNTRRYIKLCIISCHEHANIPAGIFPRIRCWLTAGRALTHFSANPLSESSQAIYYGFIYTGNSPERPNYRLANA